MQHTALLDVVPAETLPPVAETTAVFVGVAGSTAARVDVVQFRFNRPSEDLAIRVVGLVAVIVNAVGIDLCCQSFPLFVRQVHAVMAGNQKLHQRRGVRTVGVRRTGIDILWIVPAHRIRDAQIRQ